MNARKTVMILGSFAPSLINFRGPLISELRKLGHRVIATAPKFDTSTAAAVEALGAEPREVLLSNVSINPIALFRSILVMRALIKSERPDVLIAYTIKPVIVAALAGRAERVPTIVSLITGAGYAFTEGREIRRRMSRLAAYVLYRIALKRSHVVIFQNPDDLSMFKHLKLLPPHRSAHIVNGSGVDIEHFASTPLPSRTAFLMVGRLLRDKGVREFATAAKRLRLNHPEVPIALVGDLDPSPDSLRQDELDDLRRSGVDCLGYLSDVRPAIATSSVLVLPSYREGTPRSVLEAMAMGRAIITTDAPGCRETVQDGENGFLVRPRDAQSLYEAMLRFVQNPELAEPMGQRSRKIAEEKYDVRKVNEHFLRCAGLSKRASLE